MITVYGGGGWGTALAALLAGAGHSTCLLLRDGSLADCINNRRENPRYLLGARLPESITATTDISVLGRSDIWVLAVPCQMQRRVLENARDFRSERTVMVNAAKGFEMGTLLPLSVVTREALGLGPDAPWGNYAVISGPSFAREVAEGKPAAVSLGCADAALGMRLRDIFTTPRFRCYFSADTRGVEVGGAVKNVIAIAAGVCDGLGLGDNARAALVTRGLAEITRLGIALGARPATFMGLSGLGDLMLTCAGDLSRNRQIGLRLGRGERLDEIRAGMRTVAEGVPTTYAVCALAEKLGVEMPIANTTADLLGGRITPGDAAALLMERAPGEEPGTY